MDVEGLPDRDSYYLIGVRVGNGERAVQHSFWADVTILAPDIVSAILSGKDPPELTARRLMDDTRPPLDWNEQRQRLGFASAH
jgi:hypothetical protein